ncbi:MAG: nickel pincer cofactor biosynthesis protein LarB [Saprospiraceae bacterium]|nr:nickel pincer cofactor biosynthesis protein LarB [Saprospiraceae bacterium]
MSKAFELDEDRENRLGFEEVIYGAAKDISALSDLLVELQEAKKNALVTKVQREKGEVLLSLFPSAFFHPPSGIFMLQAKTAASTDQPKIAVITAGTSDMGVAYEAFYTLQYMDVPVDIIQDIGVAGIHRLLNKLEQLQTYKILIVIAGFEGALPTVVGGLLPQPIIAVPTSTGYGTAKAGETALHAMLTSCANGITVVNIDNGYGAAMSALRILKII